MVKHYLDPKVLFFSMTSSVLVNFFVDYLVFMKNITRLSAVLVIFIKHKTILPTKACFTYFGDIGPQPRTMPR